MSYGYLWTSWVFKRCNDLKWWFLLFATSFLRRWRRITTIVGPGNPVPLPLCACLDICTRKTTWSLLPSTLLFVNYLSVERWIICESQPRHKNSTKRWRRRRYWHSIFSNQYSSCFHPSGFFTESSWYVSPCIRWIYPYYAASGQGAWTFGNSQHHKRGGESYLSGY